MVTYTLKEFKVLKEFLSHKSQKIYKPGEGYIGGKSSYRTKALKEHGFIKDTDADLECTSEDSLPVFAPVAKSKLLNIEIADRNYAEGDKEHFTFEEALEIEKKMKATGWRLPTRHEWAVLVEEFGNSEDGRIEANKLVEALRLTYAGVVFNSALNSVGSNGYYWSSTAYSSTNAYRVRFNSSEVSTNNNNRYFGYSVRLVRDVK